MNIDTHLAQRVRDLRKARGHTLASLAQASGVSRSMISLIERGESSATAAVLHKLAGALGVSLASLFSKPTGDSVPQPLARLADQALWQDPASGYQRRQVSPAGVASPTHLVEVIFPPTESVVFEHLTPGGATHQQVWMLGGEMAITVGEQTWQLRPGDCLAMVLGPRIVFHNPGPGPARYLLALTTTASTLKEF